MVAGLGSALWLILELMILLFWEWISPEDTIEKAVDFDFTRYMKDKESYGDHTLKVSQCNLEEDKAQAVKAPENGYYETYFTKEGKRRIRLI